MMYKTCLNKKRSSSMISTGPVIKRPRIYAKDCSIAYGCCTKDGDEDYVDDTDILKNHLEGDNDEHSLSDVGAEEDEDYVDDVETEDDENVTETVDEGDDDKPLKRLKCTKVTMPKRHLIPVKDEASLKFCTDIKGKIKLTEEYYNAWNDIYFHLPSLTCVLNRKTADLASLNKLATMHPRGFEVKTVIPWMTINRSLVLRSVVIVWDQSLSSTVGNFHPVFSSNFTKDEIEVECHLVIRLSSVLLTSPRRFMNTLVHELAHAKVFLIRGHTSKMKSHCRIWKSVMMGAKELDDEVETDIYHTYPITKTQRARPKRTYKCNICPRIVTLNVPYFGKKYEHCGKVMVVVEDKK